MCDVGYNMGPNYNMNRPYDPTWNNVPVPGVSSGMLASGMNFDYLPPQTPIMVPQPPPSPLQQYLQLGGNKQGGGAFAIGSPVRIVHMTSEQSQILNNLVGDIVAVNTIDNYDGTQEMVFDVRCPLENRSAWAEQSRDKEHGGVRPSHYAMQMAPMNVKVLGPDTNLYRDNSGGPPPYLLLKKIPSEKMEPQGEGSQGHGFRRPGPPGVEMLPTMTMPGIMGRPVHDLPPNSRPIGPMDMSMGMGGMNNSMRGGMPPSQPWGMANSFGGGPGGPMMGGSMGGGMPGSFGGGMPGSYGGGMMPTPPGSFMGGMGGPGTMGGHGNMMPPGSFMGY